MKKISSLLILLLVSTLISAQTIVINSKGFIINKVNVSKTWDPGDFKKALGETSHSTSGIGKMNRIHYHEDKGIIFWEPMDDNKQKPSKNVKEMQIFLVHPTGADVTYKTEKIFSGSIFVDRLKIRKSIKPSDVENALKTWTPVECYFTNGYKYSNGIVAINFLFNTEETELLSLDIVHAQ